MTLEQIKVHLATKAFPPQLTRLKILRADYMMICDDPPLLANLFVDWLHEEQKTSCPQVRELTLEGQFGDSDQEKRHTQQKKFWWKVSGIVLVAKLEVRICNSRTIYGELYDEPDTSIGGLGMNEKLQWVPDIDGNCTAARTEINVGKYIGEYVWKNGARVPKSLRND
ncbi:hypothetical protein M501DRAFT_990996 [Patellaria atrata CBS 101060]|uniref:Uncharacterized protein n=1 Tax=Patellaria atrata CBS 101060 TaxID=1346257 RepID=A0A9P4SGA8_9PEZI|nr:hypothetical protein M501DRAFT_990996 [Patellaria atrata CBS 101060]